jgi:hypothetical protein
MGKATTRVWRRPPTWARLHTRVEEATLDVGTSPEAAIHKKTEVGRRGAIIGNLGEGGT